MAKARPETRDASGELFNHLMAMFGLRNDADLARWLDVAAPVVSKTRHGRLEVGPTLILNVHERSELSIKQIKDLIAA